MPRCCNTVKKINSQPDLIRHTKKKTIGGLKRKVSEHRGVRKVHTDITASQKASYDIDGNNKRKRNAENRTSLRNRESNALTTMAKTVVRKTINGEWKSTFTPRKKVLDTNAAIQRQSKNKDTCPTSPNEACVAPSYFNGNVHESKSVCITVPSESRDGNVRKMVANTKYSTTKLWKPEPKIANPMSIILTNTSTVSNDSIETKPIPTSIATSLAPVCRPYQSIIYNNKTNSKSSSNAAFKTLPTSIITQTKSYTCESNYNNNNNNISNNNNNQIRSDVHGPNVSLVNSKHRTEYYEPSIVPSTSSHSSSDYSMLSVDEPNNTSMASIYRERSIEETEAAHDLLSLSQSLPPLPAPCVVTILHPVNNYNISSPDVHEITQSTDYITYTSNDSASNIDYSKPDSNSYANKATTNVYYGKKIDDIDGSTIMLPQTIRSTERSKPFHSKSRASPLTPPTSESSSDDIEYVSEATSNGVSRRLKNMTQSSSHTKQEKNHMEKLAQKSKSAQVFGMTIFDAVMINDGRSKKGNGDAEVIHVEERRKGRYKCTQCGKQYATSSNLSRHKQTHRSLDSQSAKKCMTCGKAYVSMPALAMHLLTHKLTHSCDVCGKLFSRPWLLQGHLRSHTGEKPYGCAHCGKAFADRSNLRAHMQTHSINKQFECSRCHKTFALKSYLNKHLESSCLRDEFKKCYDSKNPDGSIEEIDSSSMDEDTIDVTGCD